MINYDAKVYTSDRKNPMIFKWSPIVSAFTYQGKKYLYKIHIDRNGFWIGRFYEDKNGDIYWFRADDLLKVTKIEFFFGEWTFRKWRNGKKKG